MWKDPKAFAEDLQLMATEFMLSGAGDKAALCQRICKVASARIGKTTCEAIHQLDIPRAKAVKKGGKKYLYPTPLNLKWICNQVMTYLCFFNVFLSAGKFLIERLPTVCLMVAGPACLMRFFKALTV